jgi:hypothetical protein
MARKNGTQVAGIKFHKRGATMTNIIAAQFDDFAHADTAVRDMTKSGTIDPTEIDRVVLGAPGRHDRYPVGGDEDADAGAVDGDEGARTGAAIGGAVGAVTGVVLGPIGAVAGAALGAYGGSLAGALDSMGDSRNGTDAPPPRPAGVMVMVHVQSSAQRELALGAFLAHGARSIEEADGEWNQGTWVDFNPVATPRWIVAPSDFQTQRE